MVSKFKKEPMKRREREKLFTVKVRQSQLAELEKIKTSLRSSRGEAVFMHDVVDYLIELYRRSVRYI